MTSAVGSPFFLSITALRKAHGGLLQGCLFPLHQEPQVLVVRGEWVVFTLQLTCRGCSTPPVSHCPQFVEDGNSREQRALTAALSLHQRPRHLFNFAHLLVSSQMELIAYSSLEFFELFMKAGLRLQTLKRQHNRTSSLPTACLLSESR